MTVKELKEKLEISKVLADSLITILASATHSIFSYRQIAEVIYQLQNLKPVYEGDISEEQVKNPVQTEMA